jgi:hypothetical protein
MIYRHLPLGVTGNTPDSGSGESWFEPRRGNSISQSPAAVSGVRGFVRLYLRDSCRDSFPYERDPITATSRTFRSSLITASNASFVGS